ncbi:MAG: DUF3429 domain-containing protein [Betaproteobacteria bacterium]|jgi:hypothetical protein|nr:DUF3429 domain-containing protein [Betaproteobacteria bacterium]NBY17511.1 DUF3429 domain-containing protein [Betaproteobacteria bacterium]
MDPVDLIPANQRLALGLGLGGLLPFVGLAVLAWGGSTLGPTWALRGLILYGASILAFLGGLHWGFALSGRLSDRAARVALVWSVVPSLIAWSAAWMPEQSALLGLAGGLVLAWAFDQRAWPQYGIGPWFLRLRGLLTFVATGSLLTSAWIAGQATP